MSQMSDLGAVSPQTSMDAAALIADQHTPVHRGPAWLWSGMQMLIKHTVQCLDDQKRQLHLKLKLFTVISRLLSGDATR